MKLYTSEGNPQGAKVLITAQYGKQNVKYDVSGKAPKSSPGRMPILETPEGTICGSNACMRFLASKSLTGSNAFETAQIDSWVDFAANELEVTVQALVYPIIGWSDNIPEVAKQARKDLDESLKVLESHLKMETFLVGRSVTLADIACANALVLGFRMILDDKARKNIPCVTRWFTTCVNQPEFEKVVGPVTLVKKAVVSSAPVKQAAKPAEAEQKPKKEEKKKPAAAEEDDDEPAPAPAAKNPLDLLPKSSFVLDAWKRTYSNAPNGDYYSTLTWFWENLDKDGWSLHKMKYNYNDELKVGFQTSNLIVGFCQRCDEVRKYAFGTVQIIGTEGAFEIVGCWLIRGPSIQPLIDANPDAEYYTYTTVTDFTDEAKQEIADLWCAETTLYGKPVFDCQVFK